MKEVNFNNIKPVVDSRTTEKTARKQAPTQGGSFQETLANTVANMTELNSRASVDVKAGDSSALKEGLTTAKELYDKLMLERKNLSQLYHSMRSHKPEDKA